MATEPLNNPLMLAQRIYNEAAMELQDLYLAQGEDIVAVTITSRSGTAVTMPVKRKAGIAISSQLIELGEKRRRRLWLEILKLTEAEGADAGIERTKLNAA